MILPNALVTEFGIINYLNTLSSNTAKEHNSILTNDLNTDNSLIRRIFDDKLGSWPNSLGGCHLMMPMYKEHLDYYENSLYFGKKTVNKYIYPIKVSPHFDRFIGYGLEIGNKLNGEYFWKHMSAEALEDVRSCRAIIFLDYGQENFVDRHLYERLHEVLRLGGIPPSQTILAFNSFNAQEIYESWFTPQERRLEVRNWPLVMGITSAYAKFNSNFSINQRDFLSSRKIIRPNHFVFKIRRTRAHRLILLYKMATDNLLEKGDWSCLPPTQRDRENISSLTSEYNLDINIDIVNQLYEKFPHSLQSEIGTGNRMDVCAWGDVEVQHHKDSYFYICTETYTTGDYKSLTEKVFKPILNFQPFLFVAYPGALALLRKLGFKTFSPFINEDYDEEPDKVKRIHMIYEEITRLCSMSKEEIHAWYWSMTDILAHNHRHFLEIYKDNTVALSLIKYLHERISE